MPALTISRVHHQLRLTRPGQRAPALAVAQALPDALAAGLDRRGTIGTGVVCIRRVSTRVRVPADSLRLPDNALRRWADGLAAAIDRDLSKPVDEGSPSDVVWFRDRAAVVADVITRAAKGDLARRWAWTAAGVVRQDDPASPPALVAAVLRRHPQQAGAAVRTLLGTAPDVLRAWTWAMWVSLAKTVVTAADGVATAPDQLGDRAARLHATPGFDTLIDVLRAAGRRAGVGPDLGGDARRIARAAVALTAPELVTDTVARHVAQQALVEPALDARPPHPEPEPGAPVDEPPAPSPDPDTERSAAPTTAVGGVLFLHHVLRRLDLPGRWCQPDHPLAGRPLVESLVLLAVALTDADARDPGVLAFAGRGPDEHIVAPSLAETESAAIELAVAEVDAALAESLPGAADRLGASTRPWVMRRTARIDADPGWIETIFSIDDTDTDIRKAGLDIDPGFVPNLGCVLRFRYA